jgi:hypothetical protein
MDKKCMLIFVSVGFVLGLMGHAFASNDFNNASGDHLWSNPNNWSMSVVPDDATTNPGEAVPQWSNDVGMLMDDTHCIIDTNASAFHVMVGAYGADNELEITGGTLTIGQWGLDIGRGGNGDMAHEGSYGKVLMTGGEIITEVINLPEQWAQSPLIKGLLWMQGGFIRTNSLDMGAEGGQYRQGSLYLDEGTIRVNGEFTMHGDSAWIDFREGTLIVTGDHTDEIQGYIDSGWITAYEGQGSLVLEYSGSETILSAQSAEALKAMTPRPGNYSTVNSLAVTFSWTPGSQVQRTGGHDVYIGTNLDDVSNATRASHANVEYVNVDDNSYGPFDVEFGRSYFWRVDQLNDDHADKLWRGSVWTFTVAEHGLVDDMESYGLEFIPGQAGSRPDYTWKDGNGWTNPSPGWGGNGTGSEVEAEFSPSNRVHDGELSLKFSYDTFSKPKAEIRADTADLTIGSYWAAAKSMELWFYGTATNQVGKQMWVALEDAAGTSSIVPYGGDMNDIKLEQWQLWRIAINEFVSVDLTDIKSIAIGFGMPGDATGASGTVYFDDITVHPCRPGGLVFDFNGDCVVDYQDMAIMAENWMEKKLSP